MYKDYECIDKIIKIDGKELERIAELARYMTSTIGIAPEALTIEIRKPWAGKVRFDIY